jgi:membrane fusion protein (multidrug efflux system)
MNPVIGVKVRGRRPWGKIVGGTVLAAVIGVGIGNYLHYAAGFETTDDAFLEGNVHPVSPRISGTVIRVLVDDNAHVEAGQPLAEIDPADLAIVAQGSEADLAQAHANETQASSQIARALADVETASARIEQNAAQLNRDELDFHRAETLVRDVSGAISRPSCRSCQYALLLKPVSPQREPSAQSHSLKFKKQRPPFAWLSFRSTTR